MKNGLRTVTLEQLREMVQDAISLHGEETPVAFVCNYGDYHRTMQALPFVEYRAEMATVVESSYSESGFAALLDDEGVADDEPVVQRVFCFVYDRM